MSVTSVSKYNRHFNGIGGVFVAREMPAANLMALSPAPRQPPARTLAANDTACS